MTLHDRIMAILDGPVSGDDSWVDGHVSAVEEAADIATEADELMDEMAEALDQCLYVLERGHCQNTREQSQEALTKYNAYKEQSK